MRKVSDNGGYEVESPAASHDITMEVQDKLQKPIFRNVDHDKVTQLPMVNDEVTYLHILPTGDTVFLDKDRETRVFIISQ